MKNQNFTTTIIVPQSPNDAFNTIKDVRQWWSGLYSEEIDGCTDKLNDEFTFRAGGGAHYSKQKLIELIEHKKIVWLITNSKLNFLDQQNEWTGTKLIFEFEAHNKQTQIKFTHEGLTPNIECYKNCSNAWQLYLGSYLKIVEQKLNK